jgi:hypothetical protein
MKLWSGSKKRKIIPRTFNRDPESRRREEAIKCAKHFQKIGQAQIKGGCPKVDFQKMTLPELNTWIQLVTEALGIKQFTK